MEAEYIAATGVSECLLSEGSPIETKSYTKSRTTIANLGQSNRNHEHGEQCQITP